MKSDKGILGGSTNSEINPMDHSRATRLQNFRQAPRCSARTRGGTPCQRPAIRGRKRCRLHGGLSPGAPRGEKNGNFKTGAWTLDAIEERPEGESRACANQLAGNSLRQSVIYFPQNTPSTSISFGVSSGRNSGSKLRPIGAVST